MEMCGSIDGVMTVPDLNEFRTLLFVFCPLTQ